MRRNDSNDLWSLDARDDSAVPSARVALALIRCMRRLGVHLSSHNHDDLGAAIAPALRPHARQLRQAVKRHNEACEAGRCRSHAIDLEEIFDHPGKTSLGEALARGHASFRGVFERAETHLEDFLRTHSHASDANLAMLVRLLDLGTAEAGFLQLGAAFCHGAISRAILNFVDSPSRIARAIEALFDLRGSAAFAMVGSEGKLARSGLLEAMGAKRSRIDLEDLLALSAVGERLLGSVFESEVAMARAVLVPLSAPATGVVLEWPHLQAQRELVQAALHGVLQSGEAGVNILLHGAPGTGKTEFARQLLARIEASGFSVASTNASGGEATRHERLASLQLSQVFAGRVARAVLVLDEAEDVFHDNYNHPLAGLFQPSSSGKAWMNTLLETNAAPVIWISNRVSHLDPAYLRRFTCCLEFPQTPYALRRQIAQARLGAVGCSETLVDFAAALPEVTPAHLDAAARFAALAQAGGGAADDSVRLVIESHLRAGGHRVPPAMATRPTRFDLRYLNVAGSVTPERLVGSLAADASCGDAARAATILFSGPPGTGKTQLAGEIAARLGRRLVVRTASDINSKWYGESEANVARMFQECDVQREVLFLDEADVLLGSREAGAQRADRAVTAEFLRWLEAFEGIFVCATNHRASFDSALSRRFTFRLDFEPLSEQQRCELYAELAQGWCPGGAAEVPALASPERRELARLQGLTPGDFANAARRIRALGLPTTAWLDELRAEHDAKLGAAGARMGFV